MEEVKDGVSFEEKMGALTADLAAQMNEGLALDVEIKIQLGNILLQTQQMRWVLLSLQKMDKVLLIKAILIWSSVDEVTKNDCCKR